MTVIEVCTWSADSDCLHTPDPKYDALLYGCRWCERCGPRQIERQIAVRHLLDAGYGPALIAALDRIEAEEVGKS